MSEKECVNVNNCQYSAIFSCAKCHERVIKEAKKLPSMMIGKEMQSVVNNHVSILEGKIKDLVIHLQQDVCLFECVVNSLEKENPENTQIETLKIFIEERENLIKNYLNGVNHG